MSTKPAAVSLSDVLGLGRLAADGAVGLTGLVEHMHNSIRAISEGASATGSFTGIGPVAHLNRWMGFDEIQHENFPPPLICPVIGRFPTAPASLQNG